jgi:hydrogenase maturation protease
MSDSDRPTALVVGIGNPDRGDDGVEPAIAQRVSGRVPPGVSVLELGGDVLALIESWAGIPSVIVVDAVAPIAEPGRFHRLDLAKNPLPVAFAPPSTHAFGLAETVELARSLGKLPPFLVAYLVKGEQFEPGAPLSPTVAKAVEKVVERVSQELSAILGTPQAQGTAGDA